MLELIKYDFLKSHSGIVNILCGLPINESLNYHPRKVS